MKKLISLFLAVIFVFSFTAFNASAVKINAVSIEGTELYDDAFNILQMINNERSKLSRRTLVMDSELTAYAMTRCKELSIKFSHNRPNGESFYSQFNRAYGEDIFTGSSSYEYVMDEWMTSESSQNDILTHYYKSVGVGAMEVDGSFYWVLIFAIDKVEDNIVTRADYETEVQNLEPVSFKKNLVDAKIRFGNSSLCVDNTTRATVSFYNGITYTQVDPSSITFDSSNKDVCVINKLGKIFALSKGKTTISVTLTGDSYPFLEQDFYVNGEVESVDLNRKSYTYNRTNKNGTLYLNAKVSPTTAQNKSLVWKSSNTKVATVNSSGKVTLRSKGTAKITVTSVDSPRVFDCCNVKVVQRVTKVKLNKTSIKIKKKKTYKLKATCTPNNANKKSVSWKSGNTKVARVDKNGKVTAVNKGKTTVRATATDGSKKYGKCTITVS